MSETFSYDAFGNMATSAGAGYSFSAAFNAKNQIAEVGGFVPDYDADGDLLDDPVTAARNVNALDAENHAVTFESQAVVYDAMGRAVEAGGYELEYAPGGAMMALMAGQTTLTGFVPLPGGAKAVYSGATLAFYQHADWQGSARLMSTPSRGLYGTAEYAPFGADYDATSDVSFTGQMKIYGGNQYNFPKRNLSPIQGRWWTPDPSGLAAVDPANPQSWNAYSYVNGDPLETTDPLGLAGCPKAEQDMNPGADCPKSSEIVSSPAKPQNQSLLRRAVSAVHAWAVSNNHPLIAGFLTRYMVNSDAA